MQSRWNQLEATQIGNDPLALRVYTSRLLGQEPTLVLHGGGNTSVKGRSTNLLGDEDTLLYVKGSGWDLASIEAQGFAPVRLDVARRLAQVPELSDTDMAHMLRYATTEPTAPNPSVEAILHALIPLCYVDHTHADTVVTITNTKDGEQRIRALYGDRVIIIPYVMPGFMLAKKIYEMTRDVDWSQYEGLILLQHGVCTFGEDAQTSYERMIQLVSEAEQYLERQGVTVSTPPPATSAELTPAHATQLAQLRRAVSRASGGAMIARLDNSQEAVAFSALPNIAAIATRGPITPDHVIRTKPIPMIINSDAEQDVQQFAESYRAYFGRYAHGQHTCLDPAPRWAIWPGQGSVTFGRTVTDVAIATDIARHTMRAIQWAETLGGWHALPEQDLFEMEYWILEQAKLTRVTHPPVFQGNVAMVTGAASGIGRACTEALHAQGAAVIALDMQPSITTQYTQQGIIGLVCDVTNPEQLQHAARTAVAHFGGLDILVSNAGMFPTSNTIVDMPAETWQQSMAVNLHSHQLVLQACIPYLTVGIDPAIVIVASKNVPAPGPGAAAYSVAKAGLTQLARVAALELGGAGVRVNVIHPNQVFDTGIWTPDVLAQRAQQYGQSVEDYKRSNILGVEITSQDVAALACAMAGPTFAKTTGAQVSIDGGNDRVV